MDTINGRLLAESWQAGILKAEAEAQYPIIEVGHNMNSLWYQPVLDHPMLWLIGGVIALLAFAHVGIVFVCRKMNVPSMVPLVTLWVSFSISAGVRIFGVFPTIGGPLLIAAVVFIAVWLQYEPANEQVTATAQAREPHNAI